MILLAAFAVLLHRYTGQDDILVGTPIDDDASPVEMGHAVGVLAHPLVIRIDLSGNPTFRTLLSRVHKVVQDAYSNRDLPFPQLIDALPPQRYANQTSLFQVIFAFQDTRRTPVGYGAPTTAREIDYRTAQADLTLVLQAADQGDDVAGVLSYDTDSSRARQPRGWCSISRS